MNDQWKDASGTPIPSDWAPGLPADGEWQDGCGCAPPGGTASIDNITITGSPGSITSVENGLKLWSLVLNDGTPAGDMRLDRFDNTGGLVDSPMTAQRATGIVTFHDPVMLSRDPVEPMEAATKFYVDNSPAGIEEAPIDNTTYGRDNATWVPLPQTYMPEAPNTTQLYSRFNSTWALDPIQVDAPNDGTAYARMNGGWAPALTGGPYVPISGNVTMTGPLTFQGSNMIALNASLVNGQAAILGQKAGVTRWQMQLGDYTTEGLNNVGSNFSLGAFSTTGGMLGTWLTINRADGATTLNGSVVNVSGSLSVNQLLFVSNVANLSIPGGTPGQFLQTNGQSLLSWATPAGGGGGGIADAPNDGTLYGRKSAAWAHLTHSDITDWATAVPPAYVLPTASTTVLGGVRVDGTSITIAGGIISSAGSSGPPVTISATAPVSPVVGALWWDSVGGQMYVWYSDANSSQWVVTTNGGGPTASSTLPLANGTAAVGVSAAYARADHVHPVVMGDNRIINGDMRIDQRNNGASGTVSAAYTVDRWQYNATQTSKMTWGRGNTAGLPAFPYNLGFTSSSAYTPLTGDTFYVSQAIEADAISDFAFGTVNAQPITLSFWATSSLTGTFSGALTNYASPYRSYPFAFSIPTANVWTKVIIAIPGDISGTWALSGSSGALYVRFDLGSGATFRAPTGAWVSGNFVGANGSVNTVATNGAIFLVTGVKLEIGSVATPFNRQSLAKSLADCQRYYSGMTNGLSAYQGAAGGFGTFITLPVTMRASPTIVFSGTAYTNASGVNASLVSNVGLIMQAVATATGAASFSGVMTASAEL